MLLVEEVKNLLSELRVNYGNIAHTFSFGPKLSTEFETITKKELCITIRTTEETAETKFDELRNGYTFTKNNGQNILLDVQLLYEPQPTVLQNFDPSDCSNIDPDFYSWRGDNTSPCDFNVTNTQYMRPVKGGAKIGAQFMGGTGTMGFLAKDLDTNTVVGVTNCHVIIPDAFITQDRNIAGLNTVVQNTKNNKVYQPVVNDLGSTQYEDFGWAPNFTGIDLNGTTHNLYNDYLNQGKTVILDISTVWCGPCWNYHQTHALADFYNTYGPNGNDQAMVLFIEADSSTPDSDLSGGFNGNDWTDGTPYPIINQNGDEIASLFNIIGYPTILAICPTGTVLWLGQPSLQELIQFINDGICPNEDYLIGEVKKYYPLSNEGNLQSNTIDTATISLKQYEIDMTTEIINTTSLEQIGLIGDGFNIGFNFATTEEIDSLIDPNGDFFTNDKMLFSSGRRTGPKGQGDIKLYPIGVLSTEVSGYRKQGVVESVVFDNCIMFVAKHDNSNYGDICFDPSQRGDSGSAVLAEFNGEIKIVGQIFAGGTIGNQPCSYSIYGIFCRIDEIATKLNLGPLLPTDEFTYSNNNDILIDTELGTSTLITKNIEGKTYWQIGLTY